MTSIPQNDRRRFLKGAAVAGGVAWTAPLVASIPASAQVSAGGPTPQGVGNPCICFQPNETTDAGGLGNLALVRGDYLIAVVGKETDGGNTTLSITSMTTDSGLTFSALAGSLLSSRLPTGQTNGLISQLWWAQIPIGAVSLPTIVTVTRSTSGTNGGKMSVCLLRVSGVSSIALETPGGVNTSSGAETQPATVGAIALPALSTAVNAVVTHRNRWFQTDPAFTAVNSDVINGSGSGCGEDYPDIFFSFRRFPSGGSTGTVTTGITSDQAGTTPQPTYWTDTMPELTT